MTFEQRITAAQGYAELGMFLDANEELEKLEPIDRLRPEVLAVRAAIYRGQEAWELLRVITQQLVAIEPSRTLWHTELAEAMRYTESVEAAKRVLLAAVEIHPESAVVQYNLACYECLLGEIKVAKARLQHAFKLDPSLRQKALEDEDLKAMWDSPET